MCRTPCRVCLLQYHLHTLSRPTVKRRCGAVVKEVRGAANELMASLTSLTLCPKASEVGHQSLKWLAGHEQPTE
jgi:hypothetical protein